MYNIEQIQQNIKHLIFTYPRMGITGVRIYKDHICDVVFKVVTLFVTVQTNLSPTPGGRHNGCHSSQLSGYKITDLVQSTKISLHRNINTTEP